MISRFIILFVTILSFSCISDQKIEDKIESLNIRNDLKDSIQTFLNDPNEFTFSGVGYSGKKPQQYDRINWIISNATESDLINLIQTDDRLLKTLGFTGLYWKQSENSLEYLIKMLQDTTSYVEYTSGCITDRYRLPEHCLKHVLYYEMTENEFINKNAGVIDSLIVQYKLNVKTKSNDS